MKVFARMIACTASLMMAAGVAPAGTAEGQITNFYQRSSDGLIIVYLSGAVTGRPGCAASTSYWMVKDENSNAGKGHFAMLLAAQMAGKNVRIIGANTCVRWGDGEDIQYIQVLN